MIGFCPSVRDLEETEGCFDGTPHDESRGRDRRFAAFAEMLEERPIRINIPDIMEQKLMAILDAMLRKEGERWYRSYPNKI